jgi:flotillin
MIPLGVEGWVIVALIVVGTFALLSILAGLYRKIGPNQALIVYGFRGTRVFSGRGVIVWPMVQTGRELSLELMSFDVAPTQDLYTKQGVAVTVEAVAQIKVKSDHESVLTAAEQFLTKTPEERESLIRLVMEGHLRGIVGQLTVESIVKDPETIGQSMRNTCAEDLNKMGLEIVSFTIREIRDKNEYIANMGKPDVARIKKEADIAAAEALRDTEVRRAAALRDSAVAKAAADQERVMAEAASQTKQAEATRDLEMKRADYEKAVKTQKAQADKAYDIEASVQQQRVIAEQVRVQRIEREEQIKVQEAEIIRRERELTATMLKQAEAERLRIETLASAEKARLTAEAAGRAEAARAQGSAEAEVIRLKGTAEAEIILAKGQSEAEAMKVKAAAFHEYNQAAVIDKLLTGMPEIVRAMAEPLSKVDKITIVSTGNGTGGAGANRVVADMTSMIAQAPALFETLAGIKIGDLFARIPAIREAAVEPKAERVAGEDAKGEKRGDR